MELLALWTDSLQWLGGIFLLFLANNLFEHLFNKKLLSGIFRSVKKWWFKKTKDIEVKFVFRIDFSQKLVGNQLKDILKEFIDNFERNRQWNIREISFEVKNDYSHRVAISLINEYQKNAETDKIEGVLVSVKTHFKLGNLRDCLSSISSLSDKLMKHLTIKYNLPFFVQNGEFEIQNPKNEFDIPNWLKNEGFKLSILAQTATDFNLQLYQDHARIETKGITFEPKVAKYLEEIFINYYIGKESRRGDFSRS